MQIRPVMHEEEIKEIATHNQMIEGSRTTMEAIHQE